MNISAAPSRPLNQLVVDGDISYGIVQPGSPEPNGVPIVRVGDVKNGIINTTAPLKVGFEIEQRHSRTRLVGGEVLLTIVGSVGEAAVVPNSLKGWNVARAIAVLRPQGIPAEWLRLCLNSGPARHQIDSMLNTTVQATLNLKDLKTLRISTPEPDQISRVLEVISALDDKISSNRSLSSTAESLLVSMFESLGFDGPSSDEPAVSLNSYFDINPRYPAPREDDPVYLDMQKLPTQSMLITESGIRQAKGGVRFQNFDTLLARITPCLQNRKTGYVDFLADGQTAVGSTEYIVLRSKVGVPLSLSYFLAISPRFRRFAIRHMVGTSGRQRLSASDIANYELAAVSEIKLSEWDSAASPIVRRLGGARDETRALIALRDTLLPQLMSGRLHIRDAEKQVEAAI